MWLRKTSHHIEREAHRLSVALDSVAGAVLVGMMLLTGTDVLLRYLFQRPVTGAFELTKLMMLLIVFFGLAYTQVKKGHISVDLVVSRLSKRAQAIINTITTLISFVLLVLISWQIVLLAKEDWTRGHLSATLGIPVSPFNFLAAFAAIVFCVVLLIDFIHSLAQGIKK